MNSQNFEKELETLNLSMNYVLPFDIKTATIAYDNTQVFDDKPLAFTTSSPLYMIVAIETKVAIYKEDSLDILWELNFDSNVASVTLSDDSCLLLVITKSGSFSLFSIQHKKVIWCYDYNKEDSFEPKQTFISVEHSGYLNIFTLTESSIVLWFKKISISNLLKESNENSKDVESCSGSLEELNLTHLYPEYESFGALQLYRHSYPVGFLGISVKKLKKEEESCTIGDFINGDIETDLEFNPRKLQCPKLYDLTDFKNQQKAVNTKDGRYILLLHRKQSPVKDNQIESHPEDQQVHLILSVFSIICSFTDAVLNEWKIDENEGLVEDFILQETINPNSSTFSECKIGLLMKSTATNSSRFDIKKFPSFQTIYSIELLEYVQLVENMSNQDFWYIFEAGVSTGDCGQKVIKEARVKAISEALPEARLLNLVNRKKFPEAEKYAKASQLSSDVIHKTKINCFLNDLCENKHASKSKEVVEKIWNEYRSSLNKIKDIDFVKSCTTAPLSDLDSIKKLLFCIKDWIKSNNSLNGISELTSKVNQILKKLLTIQVLSESDSLSLNFKDFLNKDLLQYMISELSIGNLSNAFIVWERHKDEFLISISDETVRNILEAIPSQVSSKLLISFLSEDFFPPVISECPDSVSSIAEWIINKVYLMEISEKEFWPENGKHFISVFFDTVKNLHNKEMLGLTSLAKSLSYANIYKKTVDHDCYVGHLNALLQKLNWLSLLKNQFNCKLPIASFQISKQDIVFAVLDHIDLSLITDVIERFVKPYTLDTELDLDLCLEHYIKKYLQSSRRCWWIQLDEVREKRLITVSNSIQGTDRRMNSALLIVSSAGVPWSKRVTELVKKGLESDHESVTRFQTESKLVGLKEVLIKYDLRNFPLNDDPHMINVLVNYILKQGTPTAFEDAKKVMTSNLNPNIHSDIYFVYLQSALNQNKFDNMIEVFDNLPVKIAARISKRLLNFIKMMLEDTFLIKNDKNLIKNMIYVGIHMSEFLKKSKLSVDEELLTIFRCLIKLQGEFDTHLTISEMFSVTHCQSTVKSAIEKFLDNQTFLKQGMDITKKHQSNNSNISRIFRFGNILQVPREKVLGFLITHCLQSQKYDLVLKLLQESIITEPTEDTAEAIMQVVQHFYLNFNEIKDKSFGIMVDTIYNLNSLAITFCKEDLIQEFMNTAQFSSFLYAIKDIVGEKYLNSSEFLTDSFHKWKFYPLYKDEGFQLDSDIVNNFVVAVPSNCITCGESLTKSLRPVEDNFIDAFKQLVFHMQEKGQGLAAFRTLMLYFQLQIKDTLRLDSFSVISSEVETTTFKIVLNALSQRLVDLKFAFDLLKAQPIPFQLVSIKTLLQNCSGDVVRLSYVGKIGVEVCLSLEKYDELPIFDGIHRKTSLLCRKKIKSVPHTVIMNTSNPESSWNLVSELITSTEVDLQTVNDCCLAFKLPRDHVMIVYLNQFISQIEKNFLNGSIESEEVSSALKKVETIIWCIESEEAIYSNFNNLKKQISPYSYEILLFIEEQLLTISANIQTVPSSSYQKTIELLKFLKVYRRISPPSSSEIYFWSSLQPMETELPTVAYTRLPFNIFSSENPTKVINPEVTASTLLLWLKIAPLLQLSSDHLIVIAVKNQVLRYLSQYSSKHVTSNPDAKFVVSINNMLEKIRKSETSVGCASWVINKMPPGGNKTIFAKIAVNTANRWYEDTHGSEQAMEVHKKLCSLLQTSEIERIVYKNNLPPEKILQLAHSPSQLIEHLIENYTLNTYESLKMCKAATEISNLVNINFHDIILSFISKWVNISQTSPSNLDESFAHFDSPGLRPSKQDCAENNKIRIINSLLSLYSSENSLPSVQQSLLKFLGDMSNCTRARYMFCLVSVFGAKVIAEAVGFQPEQLEEFLVPNLLSAELHDLGVPCSVNMLAKCNKVELIQKVLSANSHNSNALLLCVRLCLEYEVWNASIWEIILQRMLKRSMIDLLEEILPSIQGHLVHLWHKTVFIAAWNSVIRNLLEAESSDSTYTLSKVYKTLLRCPCPSFIEVDYLKDEVKPVIQKISPSHAIKIENVNEVSSLILIFKELVEEQFQNL